MKPSIKPFLLAILVMTLTSVLLVGCGGRGLNSSPSSGTSPVVGPATQTISGTVIGLTGTGMVLQDNGTDDLTIKANGAFTFKTAVTGAYAVTVKTQPTSPTQTCTVASGTGTATANITNVVVNCGSGL